MIRKLNRLLSIMLIVTVVGVSLFYVYQHRTLNTLQGTQRVLMQVAPPQAQHAEKVSKVDPENVLTDEELAIASKVVRTWMCDADVRRVVIRNRRKVSKPYRYFCVWTTDLTLEIPQIGALNSDASLRCCGQIIRRDNVEEGILGRTGILNTSSARSRKKKFTSIPMRTSVYLTPVEFQRKNLS